MNFLSSVFVKSFQVFTVLTLDLVRTFRIPLLRSTIRFSDDCFKKILCKQYIKEVNWSRIIWKVDIHFRISDRWYIRGIFIFACPCSCLIRYPIMCCWSFFIIINSDIVVIFLIVTVCCYVIYLVCIRVGLFTSITIAI